MSRRGTWSLAWLCLGIMVSGTPAVQAQSGEEDEPRQRQVMERFLSLLEKSPRRGTALDRVYSYHVERGSVASFIDGYHKRTVKTPDDGNAWLLLGLFELQRGHDAAAVSAFREAEKHLPEQPLPAYYLGQALVMVGQPDAAAEAFERAIARKPTRTDLLEIFQALGKVHQRARRFDQALAVSNRLEKLLPDDLRVQDQVTQALIEEGQFAEALPKLESLAKKVKDTHRQIQLKMEAAELKVRLGRTNEALADFEGLLGRLNPDAWLYREARRKLEDIFLRNDDLAGLTSYYEQWIKKTPDDLDALTRLGRFLALQGRSAEARQWLDKAVKLAPSRREIRIALIEQLTRQGQIREAAVQYEALAEQEPKNADTLREWGRLLLKDTSRSEADRKAAAARVWERLANAKKDDAVSIAQVGDLFRQAEMTEQAIAQYKKAIALAPDSPQYREYLGEYYQSLNRPDDAVAVWSEIASGPRRSVKTVARLSEILAGFGHLKEAIKAGGEAVALDKNDLTLRMKQAAFLQRDHRLADAAQELEVADKLAESDDEKEEVLRLQLENFQAAGTLPTEIDHLKRNLESGKGATAARWLRLARLYEADRRLPEASDAIRKAIDIAPKSVPAWSTSARLHETSGDLLGAANGYRKLVLLDRRSRSEYLTNIAKLEARLGRRDEALQAGRDLLASAPGNTENYQVFANLCFQLGANEEGLDTLRRSLRLNPTDPKVLLNLAEALALQLHVDEAIEIYWRALAKSNELDAKLNVVSRLVELYLQRNQLERMIGRLEREFGNADQQRELAICLAQAYSSAGDYGLARQELERILATNPRDTQLLKQLSTLAETEGSLEDASKFQKQLNDLAPSDEGTSRLAQLYVKSGDMSEAESLWEKISAEDQDTHRVLQAVDSLLGSGKPDAALTITGRLLRAKPNDWEALYREGVAFFGLDRREEATRRFQALLDQDTSDDALSAIVKAKQKGQYSAENNPWKRAWQARKYPLLYRIYATYQIREATGLDARNYFGNVASSWSPSDFGEARFASVAWLYRLAEKQGQGEQFIKERREAAANAGRNAKPRWDWFYFQMARQQARGIYQAARELARNSPQDVNAQWAMLHWLGERNIRPGNNSYRPTNVGVTETVPPLPNEEIDLILSAYQTIRLQRPDIIHPEILTTIDTELKRAEREKDRAQFYHDAVRSAVDPGALGSALMLAAERGDVEGSLALFDKFDQTNSSQFTLVFASLMSGGDLLARLMNARAQVKSHADLPRILDHYLRAMRQRPPQSRRTRSTSPLQNRVYFLWLGRERKYMAIDFPSANDHIDRDGILLLRNAYELMRRDAKLPELFAHLRRVAKEGTEIERIHAHLLISYLNWWQEDKTEAVREIAKAIAIRPSDPELKLTQAEIFEQNQEPGEALKIVDTVEPLDQRMMQRRELLALRLAVLTGKIDRARQASERLFGLRLEVALQSQLADQMNQLGMPELAEAILVRARRRAGNGTAALVSLLRQYHRQNRTDLSVQVALQILRRGGASAASLLGSLYNSEEEQARSEAISTLARAGRLKGIIERLEAQVRTSPQSLPLQQSLAEYYRADGQTAKAHATFEKILTLRPKDAKVRYQIATQLLDDGEPNASLEHFRIVLKSEPSLFRFGSDTIFKVFRQARQVDELITLLDQTDLRLMGHPYYVTLMLQNLLKEKEPKRREAVFRLVRKLLDAYPNDRMYILSQIKDEDIWRMPEMLGYAQNAVIPSASEPLDSIWHGFDEVMEYGDDGRMVGVCTRLLEIASRQHGLRPLLAEIDRGLKQFPTWVGGQALRASVLIRLGNSEEAIRLLRPIVDDGKAPLTIETRWLLAQELENFSATLPFAIELYEKAGRELEEIDQSYFQYSPLRRLVPLYERLGRLGDARSLLMVIGSREVTRYPAPLTNQALTISNRFLTAQEMLKIGLPADAARMCQRLLENSDTLKSVQSYYLGISSSIASDYLVQLTEDRWDHAVEQSNSLPVARYAKGVLSPSTRDDLARVFALESSSSVFNQPLIDLLLVVEPKKINQAQIHSTVAEALTQADASTRQQMFTGLARLHERAPEDLSVLVLTALMAIADGTPEHLDPALRALDDWISKHPVASTDNADHVTTLQQAEATRQLPLWLVARCLEQKSLSPAQAERFGNRAIQAAERLSKSSWVLAILQERGELAWKRGDHASAEALWNRMLERILKTIRVAETEKGVPVATPELFREAAEFAQLTAQHQKFDLSRRALLEVLRGGPPVQPITVTNNNQRNTATSSAATEASRHAVALEVENAFATLDPLWDPSKESASKTYETLRQIVLTEARPNEIFLYERPLTSGGVERPSSVGALLVRWGKRAGQLEDLKTRVHARSKEARTETPASILLGQIGLEIGDLALTREALNALARQLTKGSSTTIAEQACHLAVPSLQVAELRSTALTVLEATSKALEGSSGEEPMASLSLLLARDRHAQGQTEETRKALRNYSGALDRTLSSVKDDAALELRKKNFLKLAGEQLNLGLIHDALDTLGQYADAPAPQKGELEAGDILGALQRQLAAKSAKERYAWLKTWSLPTAERKSVRILAGFTPRELPPAGFGTSQPANKDDVISTVDLLIDAAKDQGTLDALSAEAVAAVKAKLAHAENIAALLQLARGQFAEAEPQLQAILTKLPGKIPAEPETTPTPPAWPDLLVSRACLQSSNPKTFEVGEALARVLLDHGRKVQSARFIALIDHELAVAQIVRQTGKALSLKLEPNLMLWNAVSLALPKEPESPRHPALWAENQGTLRHAVGSAHDFLMFRYPLTGSFTFSAQVTTKEHEQGHLAYGGLIFEALRPKTVSNNSITQIYRYFGIKEEKSRAGRIFSVSGQDPTDRLCRSVPSGDVTQLTLEASEGKVRALVNGHLYYEDASPVTASPWLGLYAPSGRQAQFSDLSLQGNPIIPREVLLSSDPHLRGWMTPLPGETLPSWKASQPEASAPENEPDWISAAGEIQGRRLATPTSFGAEPSLLTYFRPLQAGEQIRYEFFAKPGEIEVHPALGRLVFLLEPEGVRLRWVSDHSKPEGAGASDNPTIGVPNARQGPKQLPWKFDDWNQAVLKRDGDKVTLDLNGIRVFEHTLEAESWRPFGLYHDKNHTSARARDIRLSGPWPESLPQEVVAHLADRRPDATPLDSKIREVLAGSKPATSSPAPVPHAEASRFEHWTPVGIGNMRSLLFDRPLHGDFVLSAKLSLQAKGLELGYGGVRFGLSDVEHYRWANDEQSGEARLEPALPPNQREYAARLEIKGQEVTFFVEGRPVRTERLAEHPDPWPIVDGLPLEPNALRELKIEGRPTIPNPIEISPLTGITCWKTIPDSGGTQEDQAQVWSWQGEELVGRVFRDIPGSRQESRLQYHRPLLEDGEVTYEFFMEPDARMVHPSLGNVGLLLAADGISVLDFAGKPGKPITASQRLIPKKLPLRPNTWNQVTLSLAQGRLTLQLNGETILEQPFQEPSSPQFGLFHFMDETEARVRKIRYQGNWAKSLPSP